MTLLDILQEINKQGMDSAQLTDFAVGTVTAVDPIEITMDVHQAALKEEVLIFTDEVRPKSIGLSSPGYATEIEGKTLTISRDGGVGYDSVLVERNELLYCIWGREDSGDPGSTVINQPLAVGDKVLLLSVAHGQKYIVLSRL